MAIKEFQAGKALSARALNEIVRLLRDYIVAGPGVSIQRLGDQIMISVAPRPIGGLSDGAKAIIECEITSLGSVKRATWNNGTDDIEISLYGQDTTGLEVGDVVLAAYVPDADDGAMKWVIIGGVDLFGTPITCSNVNAEGSAATLARSNHTHNVIPRWQ